ncbi:MAG: hypothetical protein WCK02_08590 [Bacteroidota bacterium]
MEIRLKILELLLVIHGLLAAGVIVGLVIAEQLSVKMGAMYFVFIILPTLTIIVRKRFKVVKSDKID